MEQGLLHFLIVSDGPQSSFLSGGTAPHFQLKWGGGGEVDSKNGKMHSALLLILIGTKVSPYIS